MLARTSPPYRRTLFTRTTDCTDKTFSCHDIHFFFPSSLLPIIFTSPSPIPKGAEPCPRDGRQKIASFLSLPLSLISLSLSHFKMAASGGGTLSASAAAWPSPAQRKPRKRFRIDEDVCLLKEVVCADPFSNPAAWEDVLRNVMRAVNRELTIRGIK